MIDKITFLIDYAKDGEIKDRLIALAGSIRSKDHLLIDIKEFSGLIDPELVEEGPFLGDIEIQL
jgi:hypothetical protein